MSTASFRDQVVEFFTLREARRRIAAVPEETRSSVYRGLRLAFQKREAAETLWPRGSTAEALRLAAEATAGAGSALSALAEPVDAQPPWLARAQARATEASKELAGAQLPSLESDAQPSHEPVFRTLIDSLIAIEDLASTSMATPKDLRHLRNVRLAATAFGLVIVLAGLGTALRKRAFASSSASGQHGPDTTSEKAYDGDTATGWFLPDRVSQGWIELELAKPRAVRVVHLLASNPPYNDRGIRDARLDALLGDVIVKSIDLTLPEPTGTDPNWNDVVLDAPKCDHLRITAKSNYKLGLGIAEIEIK
jgi:hypothetical protein